MQKLNKNSVKKSGSSAKKSKSAKTSKVAKTNKATDKAVTTNKATPQKDVKKKRVAAKQEVATQNKATQNIAAKINEGLIKQELAIVQKMLKDLETGITNQNETAIIDASFFDEGQLFMVGKDDGGNKVLAPFDHYSSYLRPILLDLQNIIASKIMDGYEDGSIDSGTMAKVPVNGYDDFDVELLELFDVINSGRLNSSNTQVNLVVYSFYDKKKDDITGLVVPTDLIHNEDDGTYMVIATDLAKVVGAKEFNDGLIKDALELHRSSVNE